VASDPTFSAVVTVLPEAAAQQPAPGDGSVAQAPPEDDPALQGMALNDPALQEQQGKPLPPTMRTMSKVKSHFTSAGFEVHAPFHSNFSIGGPRSLFERVFGDEIVMDETSLGASIHTSTGSLELTLDALPPEIRDLVESVAFVAPPELPGLR
jgi:hypothetical protein